MILNPFEYRSIMRNRKLNENKKANYDSGCIMACIDKEVQKPDLNTDNLYTDPDEPGKYGIEDEQHITLLFGISQECNYEDVIEFLKCIKMPSVALTSISLFENEKYDVVKFEVDCPEFHLYNKLITLQFPYSSSFPNYVPHMTISYMLPGTGKEYVTELDEYIVAPVTKWIYSEASGRKTVILSDGTVKIIREANKD